MERAGDGHDLAVMRPSLPHWHPENRVVLLHNLHSGVAIETISVRTTRRCELVEITDAVREAAGRVGQGVLYVFVPHTTAGVTIQENADPDVKHDLVRKLEELVPKDEPYYRHAEGNSDSHLKTAMLGSSEAILVENGRPVLGTWQGVYLAEFDGPRTRKVLLRGLASPGGE